MKKLSLLFLFCLIPTMCFSAELLVRAKPHWMDSLTQSEVDKMTPEQKQSYEARSQIGDIIVVRPDGWKWGKEECLPTFIVVKIPDLKIEDAQKYEESLIDTKDSENPIMLKHRKYQIPKTIVDNAKALSNTNVSVDKQQQDTFIANITQKTK